MNVKKPLKFAWNGIRMLSSKRGSLFCFYLRLIIFLINFDINTNTNVIIFVLILFYRPKIGKARDQSDTLRRHTKGCNCKRSGCLKNYCECYEAKIVCSANCKCIGKKPFIYFNSRLEH